jgi:hypothetical protein
MSVADRKDRALVGNDFQCVELKNPARVAILNTSNGFTHACAMYV